MKHSIPFAPPPAYDDETLPDHAPHDSAEFGSPPSGAERPLRPAMLRGWRRRCPCCGSGPLLRGYLTVRDTCAVCGEELHHQRADDGPAYLTIVIVGKLMAPLLFWAFVTFRPDPMVLASLFSVGSVALSIYLLPRLKGMMVGIQWSRRMHGFGDPAT